MARRTRLWVGLTLLLILLLNYAIIGYPLVKKKRAVRNSADSILIQQVKKGRMFKGTDEGYVLEILERERSALDSKTRRLNTAAISCVIVLVSWTVFGLVFGKKK